MADDETWLAKLCFVFAKPLFAQLFLPARVSLLHIILWGARRIEQFQFLIP